MEEQIGVLIEQGPADWQIVQQDERGKGRIELGGSGSSRRPDKWRCAWCGRIREWLLRLVWTGRLCRQRRMGLGRVLWNTYRRAGFIGWRRDCGRQRIRLGSGRRGEICGTFWA